MLFIGSAMTTEEVRVNLNPSVSEIITDITGLHFILSCFQTRFHLDEIMAGRL